MKNGDNEVDISYVIGMNGLASKRGAFVCALDR